MTAFARLSTTLACAALVALAVFAYVDPVMNDPDIWWHLRNAELLLSSGHFPTADTFTFSAAGTPWLNHAWLSELVFLGAYKAFGLSGIYGLELFLCEAILVGLFFFARAVSKNDFAALATTLIAVALSRVSFAPRMLLFGWLFLLVELVVLHRFRNRERAPMWLLPPVFCLWENCHGSWLGGFIVFAVFFLSGLFSVSVGALEGERWTAAELKRLVLTGLASLAALLVNPFLHRLPLYPFDLLFRQKLNTEYIEEYASIDFHNARGKLVLFVLVLFVVVALVASERWRLEDIGLVLLATYMGLTYIRFLFLAAILVTPIFAKRLAAILPRVRPRPRPILGAAVIAFAVLVMAARTPSAAQLEASLNASFPEAARAFMAQSGRSGRVFNYFNWGGYLGFVQPSFKVFIDSRTDLFDYTGVFQDYLDAFALQRSQELLDKHRIDYVLFPPGETLVYFLESNHRWRKVYEDGVAVLLARDGGPSSVPKVTEDEPSSP